MARRISSARPIRTPPNVFTPMCPGLKICTPATPRDAKGLLKTAVRDNNPVLVLECELFYSHKGMVEAGGGGVAHSVRRSGDQTRRERRHHHLLRADRADGAGRGRDNWRARRSTPKCSTCARSSRSICPRFSQSVAKTHRVVIAEQDRPFCGVGAEISYRIQKEIFDELDAPIMRVSQEDVPMPYNERLEKAVLPECRENHRRRQEDLLGLTSDSSLRFTDPMPEIQMPKLSDTMTEGTLVSWKKKVGDQVNGRRSPRRDRDRQGDDGMGSDRRRRPEGRFTCRKAGR